ncbi:MULTISPECIES: nickel ABC transporter permease [Brevibacillus]|uniref:Nickel import system permease protein NikB n=1 Tax=Brevibacillus brevis (strain 47 / JCM 6285 / NBRC 100599) TaxID=358681 RepID=C0Z5L6_BREBN|nr:MULTISPECIES: nickel ABC transporter permease [Bacillales]MBH0328449.1 peptide ABC transporter permease [Brevibacillus brevis]NRR04986.1 ABC transporter permease [Brevibacillus sp. RS1.1]NRS47216.1 ABC transporter permease [Brevibacillus sp. HB2.2]OUQ86762.1 peptide ABC transporter permease [Brevibacillus brevis]TQR32043.1 ABC transporter permease [Lysinibacillus sp. SDF0063]
MKQYIVKRLLSGIIVLFGLSVFTFLLIHLIPGDPVRIMLGQRATVEQIESLRGELGLNKPLVVQYLDYASGVLKGDLGTSLKTGRPVSTEIADRFPATAKMAVASLVVAVVIGIGLGVLAAKYKDTPIDGAIMTFSTFGMSIPGFWLGLLVILVFSVHLGWFPIAGGTGLKDMVLPAFTLGTLTATALSRLTRAGMVEVLSNDYIRTARAKGMNERVVLLRHAFRNVMIPIVAVIGLELAGLLGGAVIIEQVFGWPGVGTLAIQAISSRDFPMIQGTTLFIGAVYVLVVILIDVLYAVLDPRIDYAAKEGV